MAPPSGLGEGGMAAWRQHGANQRKATITLERKRGRGKSLATLRMK
jgi:hypothetical protein